MRERIENIIREFTRESHLYLVDLKLRGNKIDIFLDGDCGVNIKECAALNHYLHKRLEEDNVDMGSYYVEISSPGIDRTLESVRDFKKNVGRKLQIKNQQNKFVKGSLSYVDGEKIVLSGIGGKKKNEEIRFSQIKEAKVVI